eukprot:TRINITY_DN3963_c3_g1_i1.p1 TRINITY_DN3963_c3_g1~~TRINITY_DN3963_c3_g1_i1.p1  ORF type:complete len:424 (-),score=98.24 TRINITY_DN3963_c3_g1_i1:122-1264(-)
MDEKAEIASQLLGELRNLEKERVRQGEQIKQLEADLRVKKVNPKKQIAEDPSIIIAVVIFCYNRPGYLNRTLDTLFSRLPTQPFYDAYFPVFVSQDGNQAEVTAVIDAYPGVFRLDHSKRLTPHKSSQGEIDSYYYLSQHFGWALGHLFDRFKYDAVIILEDDLEVSVDFFSYFRAMYPILVSDPTLFCVSAWNDNGQSDKVSDPYALFRSNFFPGLGWMLTRQFWKEIGPRWPAAYWDDWLREPQQRQGRDCIRPEICRTYTFGKEGSSAGQFFGQYLAGIKLNDVNVDWQAQSLTYLTKDNYDVHLGEMLKTAVEIKSYSEIEKYKDSRLIYYYNDFPSAAREFKLMDDTKAGVPRAAYNGIVTFHTGSNRIFVSPRT